ncbi:MAG: hypothetical protein FWC67_03495 [Defluviitaleaceae bacterium]|nr:hypothetical protein [Defluviitaleaceae bacterium]
MKKKLITAGLCALALTAALAHGVHADEVNASEPASVAGFWRKKDKADTPAPETTTPAPQEAPATPSNAPVKEEEPAAPQENPGQTSQGSFVRYHNQRINNRTNTNNQTTTPVPAQGGGVNDMQQYNVPQEYRGTQYVPGISEQIEKILASQPAIRLDPNAYIIQHEDALWLVMGNIRAKLDILIYVDGKHIDAQYPMNMDRGNSLPIFK